VGNLNQAFAFPRRRSELLRPGIQLKMLESRLK
jgi:hypothetical protein